MKEIKQRLPVWLYPSTIGFMDNLLPADNSKSRSELIENAILFYCGYMTTIEKNQYIPDVLSSLFTGIVESSEDRVSRLLFKMVVEQNMLMRIISTQFEFEDEYLQKLRGLAIEDVKRSNGNISLKEINKSFEPFSINWTVFYSRKRMKSQYFTIF